MFQFNAPGGAAGQTATPRIGAPAPMGPAFGAPTAYQSPMASQAPAMAPPIQPLSPELMQRLQTVRPPLPGRAMTPLPGQAMAPPMPLQAYGGQRPPMPPQAYGGQRPPMPLQAYGGQRPPMPPQAFAGARPPMPLQAYGGQRPPMPQGSPFGPNAGLAGIRGSMNYGGR